MENQILDQEEAYSEVIQYASFWERVGASIIDGLIMLPVIALNFYNTINIKSLILAIVLSFVYLIYKIYMEGTSGATFGKRAMKIKVVNENNTPINLQTAAVRASLYIINALVGLISTVAIFQAAGFDEVTAFADLGPFQQANGNNFGMVTAILVLISVIFVAFDSKKQALHDKIAKTICIVR